MIFQARLFVKEKGYMLGSFQTSKVPEFCCSTAFSPQEFTSVADDVTL